MVRYYLVVSLESGIIRYEISLPLYLTIKEEFSLFSKSSFCFRHGTRTIKVKNNDYCKFYVEEKG